MILLYMCQFLWAVNEWICYHFYILRFIVYSENIHPEFFLWKPMKYGRSSPMRRWRLSSNTCTNFSPPVKITICCVSDSSIYWVLFSMKWLQNFSIGFVLSLAIVSEHHLTMINGDNHGIMDVTQKSRVICSYHSRGIEHSWIKRAQQVRIHVK